MPPYGPVSPRPPKQLLKSSFGHAVSAIQRPWWHKETKVHGGWVGKLKILRTRAQWPGRPGRWCTRISFPPISPVCGCCPGHLPFFCLWTPAFRRDQKGIHRIPRYHVFWQQAFVLSSFLPFMSFCFERSTVGVYLFLLQLSIPPFSQWADDTHFKKKKSGLMTRILHVLAHRSITATFILCQPSPKHVQCQTHTHLRG